MWLTSDSIYLLVIFRRTIPFSIFLAKREAVRFHNYGNSRPRNLCAAYRNVLWDVYRLDYRNPRRRVGRLPTRSRPPGRLLSKIHRPDFHRFVPRSSIRNYYRDLTLNFRFNFLFLIRTREIFPVICWQF